MLMAKIEKKITKTIEDTVKARTTAYFLTSDGGVIQRVPPRVMNAPMEAPKNVKRIPSLSPHPASDHTFSSVKWNIFTCPGTYSIVTAGGCEEVAN
jgi:hypothetical protein